MEIIVLFVLNIALLFLDLKFIPKVNITIFEIIIFAIAYFIFVYKKYYLHSRKHMIIFSSLIGIFLGEMQMKGYLVLKKGTVLSLGIMMGVVLLLIIVFEMMDIKKVKTNVRKVK